MSLPPTPMPDPESLTEPAPALVETVSAGPIEPILLPPPPPRFPAWSGWDVLAVLVFTTVAIVAFITIAAFVAHSLPAFRNVPFTDLKPYVPVVIAAQAAAYPLILLFIFLLVRSRSHESFSKGIEWNWPGSFAPGYLLAGGILALAIESLSRYLPIPKSLPMDNYFTDATSAYMMAAFGLTLAPLLEELFFRGLLYPLLRRWFGLVVAVVLTAAAFASIHGAQLGYAWAPVFSIFVVGVVFTVVRVRMKSVAASFLMHCGYNFALFALLWFASDHYRHLEKVAG